MAFNYQETVKHFENVHPLTDFLVDRWYRHMDGSRYRRIIWDVSLIEAMIHPDWAEEIKVTTFENPNVWIYRKIDALSMKEEFFKTIVDHALQLG